MTLPSTGLDEVKNTRVPEWLNGITVGELIAWVIGAAAVIGALIPAVRAVTRATKAISTFLHDWNGTEDRLDRSGRLIEKGSPGIPALLETVRAQVQNSHNTNLRDDLDKISKKLDEHIVISKHHDRDQTRTARTLHSHLQETERWAEMLEDLHEQWSDRKSQAPPDQTDN